MRDWSRWEDVFRIALPLVLAVSIGARAIAASSDQMMGIAIVFVGLSAWNAQAILTRRWRARQQRRRSK